MAVETHLAKVEEIKKVASVMYLVRLKAEDSFRFQAGQFFGVEVPGQAKPGYYSMASAPASLPLLEFLVEHHESGPHSGPFSAYVVSRQAGEEVKLQGPMGKFTLAEPAPRNLFLAGGAGLGPVRSLLLEFLSRPGQERAWLFLASAPGSREFLLEEEWKEMQKKYSRFSYVPVLMSSGDNPWMGKQADPADTVLRHVKEREGIQIYLAGFNKEINPWLEKLNQAGFKKEAIHAERFG